MASDRGVRAIGLAAGMALAAVAAALAWQAGIWGAFTLSLLAAAWFAAVLYGQAAHLPVGDATLAEQAPGPAPPETGALLHRLLLDAAPTPLVALHHDHARALNRAARQMFGTDARILPIPGPLADETATHLHHEGRRWRIDRVSAGGDPAVSAVVALVDVESEASSGLPVPIANWLACPPPQSRHGTWRSSCMICGRASSGGGRRSISLSNHAR